MSVNHYETLHVHVEASAEAISKAWKIAARRSHPDRWQSCGFSSEAEANAVMAAVNEAYQILSDPQTRRAYDLAHGLIPARCGRCGGNGALRDGGSGTVIPLCESCYGNGSGAAGTFQHTATHL